MAQLSRIAPEIPATDLRASIRYYEQMLGFHLVMEMPGGDYAIVERDDVAIHLYHDDSAASSPMGVHIFTEQLDELQAELKQRGTRLSQEIVRKPWGNRDFRVTDISGNQLKFTEPAAE
jgi:uncharacterized glyoxalase superfamily protein PhnB